MDDYIKQFILTFITVKIILNYYFSISVLKNKNVKIVWFFFQ